MNKERRPSELKDNDLYKWIISKCIKDNNNCLNWTKSRVKSKGKKTYPKIQFKKTWSGHRLVWILKNGRIPKNKLILHKCDNMNCLNIRHLYCGTYKDNSRDMIIRNRHPRFNRTHCIHGHEYTKENTSICTYKNSKYRRCVKCKNETSRRFYLNNKHLFRSYYLNNREIILSKKKTRDKKRIQNERSKKIQSTSNNK